MAGIVIHRLVDDEYEQIGRVEDGELTEGGEEYPSVSRQIEDLESDEEILERFDGPYLVASLDEE